MDDFGYFNKDKERMCDHMGVGDAFRDKRKEVVKKHIIATLERILADCKNGTFHYSKYLWVTSNAGDGSYQTNDVMNLTPLLPVKPKATSTDITSLEDLVWYFSGNSKDQKDRKGNEW